MTEQPRLSIVTVVLDRAELIGHAIDSVLDQDVPLEDIEHLVIDGGSTDGTLELLAGYDHLRVLSEPDEGLYDAMNKGIRLASGEYVALLNSDDRYPAGALPAVLEAMAPGVEMIVGGAAVIDLTQPGHPRTAYFPAPDPPFRLFDLTRGVALTNARVIRRDVFDRVGEFDLGLRVAADREWLIRAWQRGVAATRLDACVYEYGEHEGSLTIGVTSSARVEDEYLTICERLLGASGAELVRREAQDWQAQIWARRVRRLAGEGRALSALVQAAGYVRKDVRWPVRVVRQRHRR